MGAHFTTPRTARKYRTCSGCRGPIDVGDRYLSHVASPDAPDLNNERWWRVSECAHCATLYGRDHLLEVTI
jgi:hypothetical protein